VRNNVFECAKNCSQNAVFMVLYYYMLVKY